MSTKPASEETKAEETANADLDAAMAEMRAMQDAYVALFRLPYGARNRALKWLGARLDNHGYDEEPPF